MQSYELFHKKGNTRRGTYFALSLSLAFHMVIFLILITASAAPAILKIGDDQIIHVFLASLEAEHNSPSWVAQSSVESIERKKEKMVEMVNTVVPVETNERNKDDVEPGMHQSRDEMFKTAEASISHIRGSDVVYVTPTQNAHKAEGEGAYSGHSTMREISLAVPRYRENTPPAYPSIARMRGYEGMVLLAAEIFTDGGVRSLKVKKSSGYEVLDRSAVKAVKTWKFEPGTRLGKPVSMWVDVPVKFILKDTEAM
jgi:TonB family protein